MTDVYTIYIYIYLKQVVKYIDIIIDNFCLRVEYFNFGHGRLSRRTN